MVQPFAGQVTPPVPTTTYPVTKAPVVKVNPDGSINTDTVSSVGPLTSVIVNATASGDNTILAGAANKTIKVYKVALSSTVSVTMTIKSGAGTALSGAIPLGTATPIVLIFDGAPLWTTTNSTDSLVINLSTTASLGGNVYVVQS